MSSNNYFVDTYRNTCTYMVCRKW